MVSYDIIIVKIIYIIGVSRMSSENTNWRQSVTGVVVENNKVLLARHTYGNGKDMLIIPGGYVNYNETPQDALKREYLEETGVCVDPIKIIGIRFNMHDWYIAFSAKYVSGEAKSDNLENSEVVWLDVDEALCREDVPDLTKKLIKCTLNTENGLEYTPYDGNPKNAPFSLYCAL